LEICSGLHDRAQRRSFRRPRRSPQSEAERTARYAGGIAMGVANEAAPSGGRGPGELDDITLTREVETEIFRPPAAPKAR
jgi:hypothetical protein